MKRIVLYVAAVLLMLSCGERKECQILKAGFMNPPHESRPMALWHWMNGNVTKDGIRKDLQWMHDIGLSGFFLFDAAYSTPQVVDTLLPYMSEGWKEAFRYAVALADSLGLEVGIASSPGWSLTGGPWVSEDDAQKKLVWSTTAVHGHFRGALPLPWKTVSTGLFHAVPQQDGIVRNYLKEIRVLAVRQGPEPAVEDITSNYTNGILDWTAPEGNWTIYRFAYTLIGATNGPAPPEATGLEVDKLDAGAVRRYWENYLGLYKEALGRDLGPGTISNIDIDSYESGKGTWTLLMEEEFEKRRGYSLALWLPALAGEMIGTDEERERFLFDWRQTLGELLAENHYDLATEIFHSHGIKRYSESHEERRTFTGDGMMVKRTADVPQGAFWVRFRAGVYATMPHMEADLRESSSVAHLYGQNISAAEAFTTNGRPGKWDGWWAYQCHPGKLKPVADAAMAEGLNRFVIHTCVHQPSEGFKPGLGLGPYGQWFNRFDTWASEARPWIDYISRSCFMLSQGRFVADIAYLYGEDTNPTARFSQERPAIPAGWNYDFVNGDALVNALEIKEGSIVSKAGASYRMLVIDSLIERMSDAVAARIKAIREAGIPVCDLREGGEMRSVLENEGISADILNVPDSVAFVHRKLSDSEIYWIANICSRPRNMSLGLRDCKSDGSGRNLLKPKVWRADRGTIEDVSYRVEDGRLFIDLNLERDDAVFVVLQGKAKHESNLPSGKAHVTEEILPSSGWDVHFVPAIDPEGAADYRFDSLFAWNESQDPFIRFFSGTATYRIPFQWSSDHGSKEAVLDLGQVFNMAHVYVNGRDLGLLWKEPYKIDISNALVEGENTLEIKVTNSWGNRLIGDSALPKEERATRTSWEFYSPDDPLPASGLLGPVRILAVERLSCSKKTTCRVKGHSGNDIQIAIDRVHSRGGGVVTVPEGRYDVGSIQLKSNVELHLEKGAYLLGGSRSEEYFSFPEEICRIRPERSSKVLLYAYDAHDIAVTGEGTIDGQGPAFFDTAAEKNGYYPKPPVERPRMVQFVRCEGVRLEGVTFKDSPCWTMLLRFCKDIEVSGISIEADQKMINNDGIDFDGCSHVRVRDSRFKTCDDCIVLRAMREYPSQSVVCEDIVVENCILDSRCQTIRLGCPSDDTIRDALFTGIEASGNNGIFADFPTRYLSSGDEGYMDIHDIVIDGYRGSFTGSALQVVSQPGVKPRRVDRLVFRNFDVTCKQPIRFIGNPGHEICTVTLKDFKATVETAGNPVIVSGCDNLILERVSINGKE